MKKIKEKDLKQAKKEREELAQKDAVIADLQTTNETLLLALTELDAQREQDRTEIEMALAELAEMGGI